MSKVCTLCERDTRERLEFLWHIVKHFGHFRKLFCTL